jgi:hypothetical protein
VLVGSDHGAIEIMDVPVDLAIGVGLRLHRRQALGPALPSSPTVAHDLAITTADEKRFAIFSRVSGRFMRQLEKRLIVLSSLCYEAKSDIF